MILRGKTLFRLPESGKYATIARILNFPVLLKR